MQGGGVDDYEDRLGGGNPCEVAGEEVGDDFFIGADGVQGVGAGEVFQNNVGANVSLCVGDGDSGVVTGFGVDMYAPCYLSSSLTSEQWGERLRQKCRKAPQFYCDLLDTCKGPSQ